MGESSSRRVATNLVQFCNNAPRSSNIILVPYSEHSHSRTLTQCIVELISSLLVLARRYQPTTVSLSSPSLPSVADVPLGGWRSPSHMHLRTGASQNWESLPEPHSTVQLFSSPHRQNAFIMNPGIESTSSTTDVRSRVFSPVPLTLLWCREQMSPRTQVHPQCLVRAPRYTLTLLDTRNY